MVLGNFTKAAIENRAAQEINNIITSLHALAMIRERIAAELAAGTLDSEDFYLNDPAGKANIVGVYDQAQATYAWLAGGGNVPAPAGDPLAYAKFVLLV